MLGQLLLAPAWAKQAAALAQTTGKPTRFDVSYYWSPDPEACLDQLEDVAEALGEDVAKGLRLVRGRENYGVIWDRDAAPERAAALAASHSRTLRRLGVGEAAAIADEGYEPVFNVSYALSDTLDGAKRVFEAVYEALGPEVGKDLTIERTESGKYLVTYQRFGARDSSLRVAQRHERLLRGRGVQGSIVAAEPSELVYGESSFLDDREPRDDHKSPSPPPTKRRPKPQSAPVPRSPPPVPQRSADGRLEAAIEATVNRARSSGARGVAPRLDSDERTAWLVYDLRSGTKLAGINENLPMQCASMVKPLVALAYFHQVRAGVLRYDNNAKRRMTGMLQRSSNGATNWVMRQAGGPRRVNAILKRHYGHLLRNTSIVEFIPPGGATYRNKASAQDYANFLVALHAGQLPSSKELLRLMALPKRNRIYTSVPEIPSGTIVYDKTGTTARCVGDFGIVSPRTRSGSRRPYIFVAIIEKASRAQSYRPWSISRANVIRRVSGVVYDRLKPTYGFV